MRTHHHHHHHHLQVECISTFAKGNILQTYSGSYVPLFRVYQHHKSIFSIRELRHLKNLEAKRSNQYILQLFCTCSFSQSLLWTDFSTWFSNRSNHEGDHVVGACKLLLIVWVDFEIQHVVIPKRTTLLLLVPSCFSLLGCLPKFNNMLSLYPRGSYCSSNCFQLVVPETPISNFLFPNSAMVNNNQIKSYYIAAVPKLFDCDHCNLMKCILSTCSIESAYDTNRGCEKSSCFVFSKKWHSRTRQAGLW